MKAAPLKSPFPYFGGKSKVADVIWERFGDVPNFVDPFCGSLAVLLSRPHEPNTETVNDSDFYLTNFWRAVRSDPMAVATHADWPVSEIDLLSRHRWLLRQTEFRERFANFVICIPCGHIFWCDEVGKFRNMRTPEKEMLQNHKNARVAQDNQRMLTERLVG